MSDEKLTREQERMLAVVYDVTDGTVGKAVDFEVIEARCDELDIFNMSDEEFEEYKKRVDERLKKYRS